MSPERWTEDDVASLGPDEYDVQEFKGSAWIWHDGDLNPEFHAAYSKQLSAFSNGAGGRILLGVDDAGRIDGGVPVEIKKGGTRSWLEDITPGLVDPPLASFNVHEVLGTGADSAILPGHAVYVVEVPPSDAAPHQALDHRYYLRIAGKSRPMGHVHVTDVLRRTRHPVVDVRRLAPYGPEERITTDPRGPKVLVSFRIFLENRGRTLARHVGAEIALPRPVVNREVRRRTLEGPDVGLTQRPGTVTFFRYHPHPVFPSQDLSFLQVWVAIHRSNLDAVRTGLARIAWRVYADDAPARTGSRSLADFAVVRDAVAWLDRRPDTPEDAAG
ncbi:MAG: ATP-binding protein [Alphaproteobacteria bacterium]|nr:ATP-binding protein [Alphaproteobacteria bacterium]